MPGELLKKYESACAIFCNVVMFCSKRRPRLLSRKGERQENCAKVRERMRELV